MRTLLNIIWLFFGGLWLFLGYVLMGLIACALIVTIPAGVACFRIASYVLWPFGKEVVDHPGAGAGSCLMNLVWAILCGIPLAVGHLLTALAQALTIIGIPLAIGNIKMIPITCFPFGKRVISNPRASII